MTDTDAVSDLCFHPFRHWDQEVQRAAKELRKPKLTKALIRCYWKSYACIGIFTLVEVPQA